jgi:hypothetical protein
LNRFLINIVIFLIQFMPPKNSIILRVFHKYPQKKIKKPIKMRFFSKKNASL